MLAGDKCLVLPIALENRRKFTPRYLKITFIKRITNLVVIQDRPRGDRIPYCLIQQQY